MHLRSRFLVEKNISQLACPWFFVRDLKLAIHAYFSIAYANFTKVRQNAS